MQLARCSHTIFSTFCYLIFLALFLAHFLAHDLAKFSRTNELNCLSAALGSRALRASAVAAVPAALPLPLLRPIENPREAGGVARRLSTLQRTKIKMTQLSNNVSKQ